MLPENYYTSSMNLIVSGYDINTQKSLAFLYTNNERSERETMEYYICVYICVYIHIEY